MVERTKTKSLSRELVENYSDQLIQEITEPFFKHETKHVCDQDLHLMGLSSRDREEKSHGIDRLTLLDFGRV